MINCLLNQAGSDKSTVASKQDNDDDDYFRVTVELLALFYYECTYSAVTCNLKGKKVRAEVAS